MKAFSFVRRVLYLLGGISLLFSAYFVVLLFNGRGGLGGIFALIGLFANAVALALIFIAVGGLLHLVQWIRRKRVKKGHK